jgi:hypothetical protein
MGGCAAGAQGLFYLPVPARRAAPNPILSRLGTFDYHAALFTPVTGAALALHRDLFEIIIALPAGFETLRAMPVLQLFGVQGQVAAAAANGALARPHKFQGGMAARCHGSSSL